MTWPGRVWGPCLTSPTGSHTISSHVSPCCPQSWAATGQRTREIHTPQCSGGFNKTVLRESFPPGLQLPVLYAHVWEAGRNRAKGRVGEGGAAHAGAGCPSGCL